MLSRLCSWSGRRRALFICTAAVDEAWIRTTAIACHQSGMDVRVVVCTDLTPASNYMKEIYEKEGIEIMYGLSLTDAAQIRCHWVITASTGLNRDIFPTNARWFVHMPHSLASLHMIYPEDAFDGFDVLFAAGPHHAREWEAFVTPRRNTPVAWKAVGYGKMDILRQISEKMNKVRQGDRHVLIAPSWGPDNLLERAGKELVHGFAERGWRVTVRPHPLFFLENSPVLDSLRVEIDRHTGCEIEDSLSEDRAIAHASVMVGDYSGTSFEFAALHGRSVVSVNVGIKEVNPKWREVGLIPVEVDMRNCLGIVVEPDVQHVIDAAERLLRSQKTLGYSSVPVERFIYAPKSYVGIRAAKALRELR